MHGLSKSTGPVAVWAPSLANDYISEITSHELNIIGRAGSFRSNPKSLVASTRGTRSAWRSYMNLHATAATRLMTISCIVVRP